MPSIEDFEQFLVTLLGELLLGKCTHRRLASGVRFLAGLAKHLCRARDVADLVVQLGVGNRSVTRAGGERADRCRDRGQRPHRPPHHEHRGRQPDQEAGDAGHDALPARLEQRSGKAVRQRVATPRAEVAQQISDARDQTAFIAEHFAIKPDDLGFRRRELDDVVGIGVDRVAHHGLVNGNAAHLARRFFGRNCIARQQRRGDLALLAQQVCRSVAIGGACDRGVEMFVERRQHPDQLATAIGQRRDLLEPLAIVRQPRDHAVDHVLLVERKLRPRILQQLRERSGRLAHMGGLRIGLGQEVARRKAELVHAAVDLFGEIADPLQPLQLGEGVVQSMDREHADDTGADDDREQKQERAKDDLADRRLRQAQPLQSFGKASFRKAFAS